MSDITARSPTRTDRDTKASMYPSKVCLAVFAAVTVQSCAPTQPPHASAPPSSTRAASVRKDTRASGIPWARANDRSPARWLVLGPFPNTLGSGERALDHDFLADIGGEARPRIAPTTTLSVGGRAQRVHAVDLDDSRTVDLKALFGEGTDQQVAYAVADVAAERAEQLLAIFGSDDGAAVWLNGERVHRLVTPGRALNPDSDRFPVSLTPGTNRVLVKVENGSGGWGFALRVFDAEGQERLHALELRRSLDQIALEPETRSYQLEGDTFPEIVWGQPKRARVVFGDRAPRVRWFSPGFDEVQHPAGFGRYIAVVETTTRDGAPFHSMLTFSKGPPGSVPDFVFFGPPLSEMPPITTDLPPSLNDAQKAELSRHFWKALGEYLWQSPSGGVASAGLAELAVPLPKGEPGWLHDAFIQDAEQKLRLRIKLEGRSPKPLAPPAVASPRAPELSDGSEAQAGIRAGTVAKLRALSKDWLKQDSNGFVVLVARRGVVIMHEGFGGFAKDTGFSPASIGKFIAGLTFARAVDQGLVDFDDPIGNVLTDWKNERTAKVTYRHCFNHVTGLTGHASHGGLFNPYLDNALFVEDALFVDPLVRHHYNGDGYNLAGQALELITGQSIWRLLYDNLEKPFGESVSQLDLGFGDRFTARYLAKVAQMVLQDGRYGAYQFYRPGFVQRLRPVRVADHVPGFADKTLEWGIGQTWMPDPSDGPREKGVLGPNVFGHGAASGSVLRIDPDHQLVVVIGRNAHKDWGANERFAATFMKALAEGLVATR